jgi:hypothetical protein
MKPETRHKLQQLFSKDISELEDLLDTDLSRWRD